ncbi:DUF6776 family protein [Advenella sp. RU8]|uniref:DUF6776 family protein n=1 Tax=Advenella sp. RU8 TaxID=3399575 RepID=UPI003AAB4C57
MAARIFLLAVGVVVGATSSYYITQNVVQRKMLGMENEQIALLTDKVKQGELQIQSLQGKLDAANAQMVVDKGTIVEFNRQVSKLQDELSRSTEELLRYEQLIPSKSNMHVSVREFDAVKEGARIRYKVMLTRTQKQPPVFNGRLHFEAKGKMNGKVTTVVLKPEPVTKPEGNGKSSTEKAANNVLNLKFSRIELAQGLLVIPDGFTPESITLKVVEGKNTRVTRTLKLKS